MRQKSLVIQRVLPIISTSSVSSENLTNDENKISGSSLCHTQTDKTMINMNETQDKSNFLDVLEATGGGGGGAGVGGDAKIRNSNSIITSATQILKEGEHQWLNSEVINISI